MTRWAGTPGITMIARDNLTDAWRCLSDNTTASDEPIDVSSIAGPSVADMKRPSRLFFLFKQNRIPRNINHYKLSACLPPLTAALRLPDQVGDCSRALMSKETMCKTATRCNAERDLCFLERSRYGPTNTHCHWQSPVNAFATFLRPDEIWRNWWTKIMLIHIELWLPRRLYTSSFPA